MLFTGVFATSINTVNAQNEKDKVWLFSSDESLSSYKQSVISNSLIWPDSTTNANAKKSFFIEEISLAQSGWNVLYSTRYKKQKIKHGFSEKFYQEAKAEGLSWSEVVYGKNGWVMVMSDMPDAANNDYIYTDSWEDLQIQSKAKNNPIFKIAYGGGKWIALCSKSSGFTEHKYHKSATLPRAWIIEQLENNLTLVDATYSNESWYIVMAKSSKLKDQNIFVSDKLEHDLIWNLYNEKISMMHYAYDIDKAKAKGDEYSKLALQSFNKGDYETAILNYTKAIQEYGYNKNYYGNRGASKYNLTQYEGAIQDFTNVLNLLDPNSIYCLRLRGLSYNKLGMYKEAIEDFTKVLSLDKDENKKHEYYVGRSKAYEALGEYKKALEDVEAALVTRATHRELLETKAALQKVIGQKRPVITWDYPYTANTTVDNPQYKISACINSQFDNVKSIKVLLNGKEISRETRGFTVESTCTENINQTITLNQGKNELQIIVSTGLIEVSAEKRYITYNSNKSKNNYHALLIGVSDYKDSRIDKLAKPVKDVESLQKILTTKYTFEPSDVHTLKNPTKAEIEAKFRELKANLTDKDNLVVFYAGHGLVDSVEDKLYRTMEYSGYWLPVDAKMDKKDTWLDNSEVYDYINALPVKHILVVADACFSGALLNAGKNRGVSAASTNANNSTKSLNVNTSTTGKSQQEILAANCDIMAVNSSCKAMTSGNLTEVPDKSLFMASFLNALEDNTDPCMPADDLFYLVNKIMRRHQVGQESKFQPFHGPKHQNGEFVFKTRK